MSTETASATTVTHRYPWTGEERAIIAVLVLAPVVLGAWRLTGAGLGPAAVVLLVVCWSAAAALYRLGARRKRRSQVTVVLHGTRLTVTGGRVGRSTGDLTGTKTVGVQKAGPETLLVLTGTGPSALRVTTRVTGHPAIAPVLREHLLACGVVLSDDARSIVESL